MPKNISVKKINNKKYIAMSKYIYDNIRKAKKKHQDNDYDIEKYHDPDYYFSDLERK